MDDADSSGSEADDWAQSQRRDWQRNETVERQQNQTEWRTIGADERGLTSVVIMVGQFSVTALATRPLSCRTSTADGSGRRDLSDIGEGPDSDRCDSHRSFRVGANQSHPVGDVSSNTDPLLTARRGLWRWS